MTMIYKVKILEVSNGGKIFHETTAMHESNVLSAMVNLRARIENSINPRIVGKEFRFEVVNYEI